MSFLSPPLDLGNFKFLCEIHPAVARVKTNRQTGQTLQTWEHTPAAHSCFFVAINFTEFFQCSRDSWSSVPSPSKAYLGERKMRPQLTTWLCQGSEGGHWQLTVSADSEEGSCGRVWECGHRIKITIKYYVIRHGKSCFFCDPTCIAWCFKLNECNEGFAQKRLQCLFWMLDAV